MAGKNRSNIMAALLTNMEDLEGAYESAMDAEGSAYRENAAYLDSIQGRVDLFMNALQTFWMNLISSDMVKWVVDQGTALIQFLDTAHGKVIALATAFGVFLKATKKIDIFKQGLNEALGTDFKTSKVGAVANIAASGVTSAKTFMSAFSKNINKTPTGLGISKAIAKNIKDVNTKINMRNAVASALGVTNLSEIGKLTKAQQKQASKAMEAAAASNKLGNAQKMTTLATAGLTSVSTMATSAVNSLKAACVAHPFMAIAAAVLVAVAAIDKFTVTAQEASEASNDKFNEIANVFDTTKSNISNLENELSTVNAQISDLEGKNLSFADSQELQRLKSQRTELENNLSIQEQILKAQEKVKNEQAVTAMKDFIKASNEGAESAKKTGQVIGAVMGGIATAVGIALAPFSLGTSVAIGATAGGAIVGATAGDAVASNLNAATVSTYDDWYKTYTKAYKEKSQAAADARKKYEKDPGDMDKYDEWQKLEQEAADVQSKMYDNLTQMQNYYSGIKYGQSEAMDKELDAWNNFLDKMNIDQNGAGAKVNALDRIFGENAADEVKAFREEIDKALENEDTKFDIAAEIEGREDLQELENQLAEIGITTDEVSDYFRKTGEIGTEAFSDLSEEITAAKTAMTNLQAALDKNTNEGYETRNTAIEEMKDLMEKGAIGSESNLWNIAEAMGFTYDSAKSIEANADALYKYIKVRDDWYQVDEDGEWGVSGANAFAEDIEKAIKNSKELQKMDIKWNFDEKNGILDFDFNNMQFDKIVEALGKTKEAAGLTNEEFIDMLTHLGQFYDVQWASGNDIVSYLEYLGTTSLSAKDQLAAVQDPLEQLLSKQNLNPKQIESYLTGNGSLKKLPKDLQEAVGAYRDLRDEMEKPVKEPEVVEGKKSGGFLSKIKELLTGDKSKEKVDADIGEKKQAKGITSKEDRIKNITWDELKEKANKTASDISKHASEQWDKLGKDWNDFVDDLEETFSSENIAYVAGYVWSFITETVPQKIEEFVKELLTKPVSGKAEDSGVEPLSPSETLAALKKQYNSTKQSFLESLHKPVPTKADDAGVEPLSFSEMWESLTEQWESVKEAFKESLHKPIPSKAEEAGVDPISFSELVQEVWDAIKTAIKNAITNGEPVTGKREDSGKGNSNNNSKIKEAFKKGQSDNRKKTGTSASGSTPTTSKADDSAGITQTQKQTVSAFVEVFGAEDVDELSEKLNNLDDKTIQAIAKVLGSVDVEKLQTVMGSLDDKTVQAIAEAIGSGDVEGLKNIINGLDDKTVQAIAEAFGFNSVEELNGAIDNLSPKTVQAIAQALGIEGVDGLRGAVDRLNDKNIKAVAEVSGQDKVDTLKTTVSNLKDKTVTIWASVKKKASDLWSKITGGGNVVNGTAHVEGIAWAGGTALKGGKWGAKKTETALVGELGPEMVVRGDRWFTVGDQGAEFRNIQRGDIIFNHKQTEEIFKNGYITSRGKIAKANGTAHAQGTAFGGGDGGFKRYPPKKNYKPKTKNTSPNNNNNKARNKGSNSSGFKEVFDWIEVKVEEINESLDLMAAKLKNAIDLTNEAKTGKNDLIEEMISTSLDEINTLEKGYKKYNNRANNILKSKNKKGKYIIPKKYWNAVKDGKISIETFKGKTDEKTLNKIKEYREWAQKAADLKKQIQEVKSEIADLAKQKFDNIEEAYNNMMEVYNRHPINRIQNYIDLTEEKGNIASAKSYEEMIRQEQAAKENLTTARDKMQQSLDESVKKGRIQKESPQWWEAVKAIQAMNEEIDAAELNIEKYNNAINDIKWKVFDTTISRIDALSNETQNLIDLMGDVEDAIEAPDYESGWGAADVKWSKEGLTSLGLYAQQMEIAQEKAKQYQKAIEELDADYKAEKYSANEYYEKLSELKDGQYDAIKSYHDAKDAIVELNEARIDAIKEGIQREIQSYQELIDKKKEELSAEKDLFDFQKNVREQQKDIATLERKLLALSTDNSASAMAKRRKLEAELAQAKQDLEDTYYERSVDNQQEMLDKNLESFEDEKDKEIKKLEKSLKDTEQLVKDSFKTIQLESGKISTTMTEYANKYGISLSDAITNAWGEGKKAMDEYYSDFEDHVANSNQTEENIGGVVNGIQNAQNAQDQAAANQNQTIQNDNATTTGAEKEEAPPSAKPSQPNKYPYGKVSSVSGNIDKGDKGKKVKALQDALNKLGYASPKLKIDGSFGPKTLEAVKKFQKKNKLTVDGIVGKKTKAKFKSKGYALGTTGIKEDQWALIDELGDELVLRPDGQGKLSYLTKGTAVIPHDISENLMKLGQINPQDLLDRNRPSIAPSEIVKNTEINLNIEYGDMLRIENFDGNNPEDVAKIVAKQFEKHTKQLNDSLRKFTR